MISTTSNIFVGILLIVFSIVTLFVIRWKWIENPIFNTVGVLASIFSLIIAIIFIIWPNLTSSQNEKIDFVIRVETHHNNEPISNAKVTLELEGTIPLYSNTDTKGYARIPISSSMAKTTGRIIVEAVNYKKHFQNIDLNDGDLPLIVQLQTVH